MKFKPNDKVKIINSPYTAQGILTGQTGTVVGLDEYEFYVDIRMDSGYSEHGDDLWPFCESELELVED